MDNVLGCAEIGEMEGKEEDEVETCTEYDKEAMRPKRQVPNHEVEIVCHPVEPRSKDNGENHRSSNVYGGGVVVPFLIVLNAAYDTEVCQDFQDNGRIPQAYSCNLVSSRGMGADENECEDVAEDGYHEGATVDE